MDHQVRVAADPAVERGARVVPAVVRLVVVERRDLRLRLRSGRVRVVDQQRRNAQVRRPALVGPVRDPEQLVHQADRRPGLNLPELAQDLPGLPVRVRFASENFRLDS